MDLLLRLDHTLTVFLKGILPHTPFFDLIFSFFSLKGNSILIWLMVMGFTIYLEERKNPGVSQRDKKFTFVFFTSFLITSVSSIFIFKNIFHRMRPYSLAEMGAVSDICPADFSFPSAHASTAFAAAAVLTYFDPKRRLFYYLVAVLISFSRIYLGCHYFLDVVFGSLLGYAISKLVLLLKLKV